MYYYDITNGPEASSLVNTYEHRAPVLDVCFGADDNEAFTAGMDWTVNRYLLPPITKLATAELLANYRMTASTSRLEN